jgi:hypothetical protein
MSKEQYVTFEVAKLLKNKGFDWETYHYYDEVGRTWFENVLCDWNHRRTPEVSCPTQQMACSWFRKEHKIHITTEPLEMFKQERIVYEPIIYLLNDFDDFALEYKTVHLKECDTNEDAVNAALEYCLTNLI